MNTCIYIYICLYTYIGRRNKNLRAGEGRGVGIRKERRSAGSGRSWNRRSSGSGSVRNCWGRNGWSGRRRGRIVSTGAAVVTWRWRFGRRCRAVFRCWWGVAMASPAASMGGCGRSLWWWPSCQCIILLISPSYHMRKHVRQVRAFNLN